MQTPPETSITFIAQIEDPDRRIDAIAELVQIYRPYVVAVVNTRVRDTHRAEDVAHDFIQTAMLSGKIFLAWRRKPAGKFRYYLRTSIRNFCSTASKTLAREPAFEFWPNENSIPEHAHSTDASEDVVWARMLFAQALTEMKAECDRKQQYEIWQLFFDHILSVLFLGSEPPEIPTDRTRAQKVNNLLVTAKRKFQRNLRTVLQRTGTADLIACESEIFDLLSKVSLDAELASLLRHRQFFDEQITSIFLSTANDQRKTSLGQLRSASSQDAIRWAELLEHPVRSLFDSPSQANLAPDEIMNESIGELIFGDCPAPVRVLNEIRKRARNIASDGPDSKQRLIHFVLYTHLICKMIVDANVRKTTLKTHQLRHNIEKCMNLVWLESDSRELIDSALLAIKTEASQ